MKTIGIKLADGTFYPILEEGTPKKRMLDLTTAKDNQTKVQIDLYRSETGTMNDAQYVDTLEVTKLNPHPNGEPELHLSVGLDEENNLTAEVVDPETGKKSETEVNLVSKTLAERNEGSDFGVSSALANDLPDFSDQVINVDLSESHSEDTSLSPDEMPDIKSDALEDMPFSFDHSEPHAVTDTSAEKQDSFDGALPDFSELDENLPVEDKTLESVNFENDDYANIAQDDDFGTESPILPNTSEENKPATEDFSTDSFSLPDFDDSEFDSGVKSESDSLTEPENFDLPDFDAPVTSDDSTVAASGLDFDDLDDPAFSSTEFDSTLDSLNSESEDRIFDDATNTAPTGSAMDFSDLYDKETIAGEHASLYDEEEEEGKKTRVPVIICIVCAIICVIATILVLFIVPSKYNLLASRNTNGVSILDRFFNKTEQVVEVEEEKPAETEYIDVTIEEPKEEAAPEAVEDKIVIAPEPEKVVPVAPPAPVEEKKPEVKKSADVKYHIRWGDTLWDLSESYYKTPWKYPKIADYNHIKNPDLIISGDDILIPAE
ncbi:MAG: LysM peptidoglycan-binding domain-containing protein [Treponema sp.]|nr:LysM peptidoglycan-binding domain-containing protein [Treponema sp.]